MPTRTRPTVLKLNLVQNGIDFVRSGLEQYFLRDVASPSAHKYAVLHVFSGLLLLLKERLSREHPSLIFARVEDSGREDAATVNFSQAIERLEKIAKVELTQYMTTLQRAQSIRNRLEHYKVDLDLRNTQEVVGAMCEFVYSFMQDELGMDLHAHLKPRTWNRVVALRGIAKRIAEQRDADWLRRAQKYKTLPPAALSNMFASLAPFHPKNNPFPSEPMECPECTQDRVVLTKERDIAVCTNRECGRVFPVSRCYRCEGAIYEIDDDFCESCTEYMQSN